MALEHRAVVEERHYVGVGVDDVSAGIGIVGGDDASISAVRVEMAGGGVQSVEDMRRAARLIRAGWNE